MAHLTFMEAAVQILGEANGRPLHYKEITRRALQQGLVQTSGLTPEATIGALLYSHVKKARDLGVPAQVQAFGNGLFALNRPPKSGVEALVEQNNREVETKLLEVVAQMPARSFEHLIAALLAELGFEDVRVVGRSGDRGLDVVAQLTVGGVTRVRTAVQAKRWKQNVPSATIREMRGSIEADQRGLVITTSGFTKDAVREAEAPNKIPISLIDGSKLVGLLVENQIGIKRQEIRYLTLDLQQIEDLAIIVEDGEELEDGASSGSPAVRSNLALGLWPVPGGTKNYVESSREMLRFVAEERPTLDEMTKWMTTRFRQAQSEKTAPSYIRVLRTLGLLKYDGERIVLTPEGAECLAGDATTVLRQQLRERVAGITEMVEALEQGPLSKDAIHSLLNDRLGTRWKTPAQTEWRLKWLENVGVLTRRDSLVHLTRKPAPTRPLA